MSKPTVKEIVAALRCRAGTEVVDCGKCLYQRDCDDPLFEDAADLIEAQAARIRELETQVDALNTSRTMRECTAALIDAIGMLAHDTGNGNCNYFEDAYSDLASTVREVAHETD